MPRPMAIIGLLVSLLIAGTASAQTEDYIRQCAAVLNAALASVELECGAQPAMTACYGSIPAGATGSNEIENTFSFPGTTISLTDVNTLTSGAANIAEGAFGIVRLTPRINRTETALTAYAYGDVTLENSGNADLTLPSRVIPVAFPDGAVVRSEPDLLSEQTGLVFVGNTVQATGVIKSGAWVRIIDENGAVGWINATLFNSDDLVGLAVVDPEDTTVYGPMQAFELTTGNTPDPCLLLPPSGLLLQTPLDAETARLQINGVAVQLPPGTTLFLSTLDGTLQVDVLEGEANFGTAIAAGERGLINDELLAVNSYPLEVYNTLASLPLDTLPRSVLLTLDFSIIVRGPQDNPLAGIGLDDMCTITAPNAPANLRESPSPGARVRSAIPVNGTANPVGRVGGGDGALWFQLAFNVWVSSEAVAAAGACGDLPFFGFVP